MHPSALDVWTISLIFIDRNRSHKDTKKYLITRGNVSENDRFPRVIRIFFAEKKFLPKLKSGYSWLYSASRSCMKILYDLTSGGSLCVVVSFDLARSVMARIVS